MHGKQKRKETRNQEAQEESSQASAAKARRESDRGANQHKATANN
jgi:hypothetical protein